MYQVTSINLSNIDLILHINMTFIGWLVHQLNASTSFFTLARFFGRQAIACPSPLLGWRRKYLHLVEVLIKLWLSYWCGGSNLYWTKCWKWLDAFGVIHIWWMESSHMLKMAMLKCKDQYQHVGTLTWWRLEYTASVQKEQLKRFKFVILLNLSK